MKTSGEVCKQLGITRKTLRGYVDIGLVAPTARTEAGYALYDDYAIKRIAFIQMLINSGYSRRDIKAFLESENADFGVECDRVIGLLEEKRSRIDSQIRYVKTIKEMVDLPLSVLEAYANANLDEMMQEENLQAKINSAIEECGTLTASDWEVYNSTIKDKTFIYALSALGALKSKDIRSKEVEECYRAFAMSFWKMIEEQLENERSTGSLSEDELSWINNVDSLSQEEFQQFFSACCDLLLNEMKDSIDGAYGPGTGEFVSRVLKTYKLSRSQ